MSKKGEIPGNKKVVIFSDDDDSDVEKINVIKKDRTGVMFSPDLCMGIVIVLYVIVIATVLIKNFAFPDFHISGSKNWLSLKMEVINYLPRKLRLLYKNQILHLEGLCSSFIRLDSNSESDCAPIRVIDDQTNTFIASIKTNKNILKDSDNVLHLFKPVSLYLRDDDSQNFKNPIYYIPQIKYYNYFSVPILVNNIKVPASSSIIYKGPSLNGVPQGFKIETNMGQTLNVQCPVSEIIFGAGIYSKKGLKPASYISTYYGSYAKWLQIFNFYWTNFIKILNI